MGVPQPTSFDDDVRDAMGEITNIIGGNMKPILPHGVGLSMPSVVYGRPSSLKICGNVPPPSTRVFERSRGVLADDHRTF